MSDADYDTWVICRHKFPQSGRSAVITVNSTLEKRLQFAEYPFDVSIAIEAAASAVDGSGRIGAQESQHLLNLSRVIRDSLKGLDLHLLAIVHGAGARTLELCARDGDSVARCLNGLKEEKMWDRPWRFEVAFDPEGKRSLPWRELAAAKEEHHLAVNVAHSSDAAADHHHYLF